MSYLAALTGSLRRASYSTAILRALQIELAGSVQLEILSPRLPLYDDDEQGAEALQAVRDFRERLAAAAGLVICTPEYSHGIPGVLKNALDWVSRPSGQSVLRDKPSLIISNSPAFTGGVRAQAQLNETLLAMHARVVAGKQIVIGGVADKFRDGLIINAADLSIAKSAVERLAQACAALESAPQTPRFAGVQS